MVSKLLCHLIEPQDAVNIDNCSVATVHRLSCVRAKGKIKKLDWIVIMYKFLKIFFIKIVEQ